MPPAYKKAGWPEGGEPVTTDYRPGCSGKIRATRETAAAAVGRRRGGSIYRCGACGGWHSSHLTDHHGRQDETELIR